MSKTFSFMWYNTENFYDTVDDPETMDDEFTPQGHYHWTQKRFDDKVDKLAHVITDIVKPDIPSIIGLAEIENKTVIMAIVEKLHEKGMKNYSFVHYDSPNERGSDVAMIYNSQTFRVEESKPILVRLPGIEDRTRDILYVKGKTTNALTLYLLFTHFPSRREGTEQSERRRYFIASELRNAVYKIRQDDSNAHIVISGDFNDTPDDHSIAEVLGAQKQFNKIDSAKLYNLLYPRHQRGIGSTYYKGWLLFDQFIVSGSLLLSDKMECKPGNADVFNPRYLIYFNQQKQARPNRTYAKRYIGGYSDHLPIFMKCRLVDKEE